MSDYDLPGMGDFLPPEYEVKEPCADCQEERDLPTGIEISFDGKLICYVCLRDYLDDHPTPSGRDYLTEEIINELIDEAPHDQEATIHYLPPPD